MPAPDTTTFYWKRLIRIVPSYLVSVLLMLFVFRRCPATRIQTPAQAAADLLTHLTFTFTFFQSTYVYTPLNVVLWTIGIEVQFYLIFPLIARFMRQKPALTLTAMALAGLSVPRGAWAADSAICSMLVNQMPSFLDVYALGMLGAILYVRLRRWTELRKVKLIVSARCPFPCSALGLYATVGLVRFQSTYSAGGMDALRQSQWIIRLPLALSLLVMHAFGGFLAQVSAKAA